MTWSDIYIVCLGIGFALSTLSFIACTVVPNISGFDAAGSGLDLGGFDIGSGAEAIAAGSVSCVNMSTVSAFLLWFGGSGYALIHHSSLSGWWMLPITASIGLLGASIVFGFMSYVLMRPVSEPDPIAWDQLTGVITAAIPATGTGELAVCIAGECCHLIAGSEQGGTLASGTAVAIVRFDAGIAWVRALVTSNEQGDGHASSV